MQKKRAEIQKRVKTGIELKMRKEKEEKGSREKH